MSSSEFTEADDHDYLLEQEEKRQVLSTQYLLDEATSTVSMETHIPESNIGYRLLQKMGWTAGKGLGSRGQGRIDPIRIELKDDSLGIGKSEEYQSTHIVSTAKRKALDSEKQLEETDAQKMERQFQVEKKQAIAKELEQVKRAFYCELCDKQYKKISEYEQHLQSYDHHHKKRFKDMKESTRNSSMNQCMREKKLAREKKREERELKRIQEAIQKKTGTLSTEQQKKPIVPISTQKSGGWTNGSAITSGWTNETTISYNGGWISSTEQQKKPIAPISAPKSSTGGGGGWINEPSGWTNQTTISNSGGSASDTSKNTTVPNNNTSTAPSETKPIFASEPKKLSFGLKKKTTSFQFGLKKNH